MDPVLPPFMSKASIETVYVPAQVRSAPKNVKVQRSSYTESEGSGRAGL